MPTTKRDTQTQYLPIIHLVTRRKSISTTLQVYTVPGEKIQDRKCKHKSHIDKIMFLCAQSRPKRLSDGTWFDGKIGIFPCGEWKPAQRISHRRAKGTLEWHNTNVDRDYYRQLMINHVLPAIALKWLAVEFDNPNYTVYIQQDGAPSHITPECHDTFKFD